MISQYVGHYPYNQLSINTHAPEETGVYYCGSVNTENVLIIHYVGRSIGTQGIKGRLQDHLRQDSWPDVTHFGYCTCETDQEAVVFEQQEIGNYQPKYNTQGKAF